MRVPSAGFCKHPHAPPRIARLALFLRSSRPCLRSAMHLAAALPARSASDPEMCPHKAWRGKLTCSAGSDAVAVLDVRAPDQRAGYAKVAEWRQEQPGIERMSLAPALRGWLTGIFLRLQPRHKERGPAAWIGDQHATTVTRSTRTDRISPRPRPFSAPGPAVDAASAAASSAAGQGRDK